jgi:ribonuclease J
VPFTLGPFTITPSLADHSAYDAFSLLIQAGGRSLFYTGDIRGHGRKASAFERLLQDPPSPVHAILMEGTSFRTHDPGPDTAVAADAAESAPDSVTLTETDVEVQLANTLRATSGLVVVLASAQNIDRLVEAIVALGLKV